MKQYFLTCLVCHGCLDRYFGTCIQCEGPAMFRVDEESEGGGYICTTCGKCYVAADDFPMPRLEWNDEAMRQHFEEQGF
jgi:hypothetical protein